VKMWKGPLKWLGGIAMGMGIAAVFGHYVRYGPKSVDEHIDEGSQR